MRPAALSIVLVLAASGCRPPAQADDPPAPAEQPPAGSLELPPPRTTGGKPLMDALSARRTIRSFDDRPLDAQTLSDLLWAASGVNRQSEGKLTAPTAVNYQEIRIYATLDRGTFLYEPRTHSLARILDRDIRDATGVPASMREAPLNLVYVADTSRMIRMNDEEKAFYSATDTGFVSQNVYLFCASEGLATVGRGAIDRDLIAGELGLAPGWKVILAQTVGYPASP